MKKRIYFKENKDIKKGANPAKVSPFNISTLKCILSLIIAN
jgi:hypothetical protein